ncbi:14867_t:CDS:1, partial [Gigaspora margarita]
SKRKKNEDYIEAQLKAYILRLKSDNIPTLIGIEPNSIDADQYSIFLEIVKKASEESKHIAKWTYISVLFRQIYYIVQKSKEKINRDKK